MNYRVSHIEMVEPNNQMDQRFQTYFFDYIRVEHLCFIPSKLNDLNSL